jgi:cytochrome c peroxidase
MKLNHKIIVVFVLSILVYACKKKSEEIPNSTVGVNSGPILPSEPYNYLANPILAANNFNFDIILTNNTITLGRVLFYDKALSFNNSISCGTCHFQDKGFADNVRFHKGVFGNTLKRNTMAISGNGTAMFWDGRSENMKDLVLRPVSNHDEMVQDPHVLVNKIQQISYYKDLFKKAYASDTIDLEKIENALTAFCVSIIPNNSRFDQGVSAFNNINQGIFGENTITLFNLSAKENKGLNLFFGKARCAQCHNPGEGGATYGGDPTSALGGSFANIGLDLDYTDNGVGTINNAVSQNGSFKIPNLKNVALTAPYMHDGRFNSLEEVVEHYNSGIKGNTYLSPFLYQRALTETELFLLFQQNISPSLGTNQPVKLGLNVEEKSALVAFLKTLTDEELRKDVKFSNPF